MKSVPESGCCLQPVVGFWVFNVTSKKPFMKFRLGWFIKPRQKPLWEVSSYNLSLTPFSRWFPMPTNSPLHKKPRQSTEKSNSVQPVPELPVEAVSCHETSTDRWHSRRSVYKARTQTTQDTRPSSGRFVHLIQPFIKGNSPLPSPTSKKPYVT